MAWQLRNMTDKGGFFFFWRTDLKLLSGVALGRVTMQDLQVWLLKASLCEPLAHISRMGGSCKTPI
jgi:hypothetical protein